MERTLAIIKPDAVRRGLTGDILKRIESAELNIVGLRKIQLSLRERARSHSLSRGEATTSQAASRERSLDEIHIVERVMARPKKLVTRIAENPAHPESASLNNSRA